MAFQQRRRIEHVRQSLAQRENIIRKVMQTLRNLIDRIGFHDKLHGV